MSAASAEVPSVLVTACRDAGLSQLKGFINPPTGQFPPGAVGKPHRLYASMAGRVVQVPFCNF